MTLPSVIVNAIPLRTRLTGVGRYTYDTAAALTTLNVAEMHYWYAYVSKRLLNGEYPEYMFHGKLSWLNEILLRPNSFSLRVIRKLHSIWAKHKGKQSFDLYWEPNFIFLDEIESRKAVLTIHDFSFHIHRQWHPKDRLAYFDTHFWRTLPRANHVVAVSEFVRGECIEYAKLDPDTVHVVHNGIDHQQFRVLDTSILQETKARLQLPDRYILCVGTVEPRKNVAGLVKAYDMLPEKVKKDCTLVLAGDTGWAREYLRDVVEANKDYIQFLGYVDQQDLPAVYNLATLFAYPSYYEGFGIPPVEAMACGTPVLVSTIEPLKEVCGDAAHFVDAWQIEDIAAGLEKLATDDAYAATLREKGLERCQRYTWEATARGHWDVFSKALEG